MTITNQEYAVWAILDDIRIPEKHLNPIEQRIEDANIPYIQTIGLHHCMKYPDSVSIQDLEKLWFTKDNAWDANEIIQLAISLWIINEPGEYDNTIDTTQATIEQVIVQ